MSTLELEKEYRVKSEQMQTVKSLSEYNALMKDIDKINTKIDILINL